MSRAQKIILSSVLTFVAILVILIIVLVTFDWNRAKPWLNEKISTATGRPFAINGDLSLTWQRDLPPEDTWHDWIPVPRLSAHDVVMGHPEWSEQQGNMAEIGHIVFSIRPLPLLTHNIVIPLLQLDDPRLFLERVKDGRSNWSFEQDEKDEDQPSPWTLDLQRLILHKGEIRYKDAVQNIDAKADIDTLTPSADSPYVMGWKLSGSFNGARIGGNGKAGELLALRDIERPFPLQASLTVGKTSISVAGTVTKPQELAAIDLQLKLSGPSMADLYQLTGITLPKTPEYATEGRLIGTTGKSGGKWTYENFKGRMGESDINGTLTYEGKEPRPLLSGEVVSNLLKFEDLGPIIGADSNESKRERGVAVKQPEDKVLPVEKFTTARWDSMDADVKLTGRKIRKDKALPIDDLYTHLKLQDSVVTLTPLKFGVAGGSLTSNIKMDGRQPEIKADAQVSARGLKLKQLFPAFEAMQASLGEINADTSLSATGDSIATFLGTSNGKVSALINDGTISKLLLEQIGLNVGNVVINMLFGDKQVQLNCMATDLAVENGLVRTRTLMVDTEDAVMNVDGTINLATEQMDLTIRPVSKGVRIVSLRAPIYIRGTFKQPDINIDKGVLALKAGSASALGTIAPITALLPLINVGDEEESKCAALLKQEHKTSTSNKKQ